MPDIKPFQGEVYDPRRVRIDEVVAPPYDVITAEEQASLYVRSPYNIIRLILGREADPYASAARLWTAWRSDGTIRRDEVPAMYLISQQFDDQGGRPEERLGFIAACRLEEPGRDSIFPHERTLSSAKEDRSKLLSATGALFSQIFCVYSDEHFIVEREVSRLTEAEPNYECSLDGVRTRLWRIVDQELTMNLVTFMKGRNVFIADGHHRYETALAYSAQHRIRNPQHTGKEAYNFAPVYFTNLQGRGLKIMPTHRILHGIRPFSPDEFLKRLERRFVLRTAESLDNLIESLAIRQGHTSIGMVLPVSHPYSLLELRDHLGRSEGTLPAALAGLDVVVLQRVVLREILSLKESDVRSRRFIDYEKDPVLAANAVLREHAQAAFLMGPPRVEQVKAVSEAGFVLPEKSTYFYPKLLSGLVMYSFSSD